MKKQSENLSVFFPKEKLTFWHKILEGFEEFLPYCGIILFVFLFIICPCTFLFIVFSN